MKSNPVCPECDGRKIVSCPACKGRKSNRICSTCAGTGKIVCQACNACGLPSNLVH